MQKLEVHIVAVALLISSESDETGLPWRVHSFPCLGNYEFSAVGV
jgi:hypothetical protein